MSEVNLPKLDLTKAQLLFERQPSGLYIPTWAEGTGGAAHVSASPSKDEDVDISTSDHVFVMRVTGIYVATSGDIEVVYRNGNPLGRVIPNVPVGYFPGDFTKILKANTAVTTLGHLFGVNYE